jgi:hypothetical protein
MRIKRDYNETEATSRRSIKKECSNTAVSAVKEMGVKNAKLETNITYRR